MAVQKMDYQPAWEIAAREWAFLPDEENQPQLSFDPSNLDPLQPLPATFEYERARDRPGRSEAKGSGESGRIRVLKTIESERRLPTPEEQSVLVRYSGWSALPNLFAPRPPHDWRGTADELKAALNEEEYVSARSSTPNAHYTSSEVVQAICRACWLIRLSQVTLKRAIRPNYGEQTARLT